MNFGIPMNLTARNTTEPEDMSPDRALDLAILSSLAHAHGQAMNLRQKCELDWPSAWEEYFEGEVLESTKSHLMCELAYLGFGVRPLDGGFELDWSDEYIERQGWDT